MKAHSHPRTRLLPILAAIGTLCAAGSMPVQASSHREAPAITGMPKVDATDFYMFNSYEGVAADGSGGRSGYVTMIANYVPLQDPYGGPNYFKMDPNAVYEIHVDNVGDAKEHITFQFRFTNTSKGKTLPINGTEVAIPLTQFGQVTDGTGATPERDRGLHADDDQRRPSRERQVRHGDQRHGRRRRRGDDDVRQAVRQHRHEDDSRLRGLRRQVHLHDHHSGLLVAGQGVRRPAQGPVRGQPRHDLRPGQRAERGLPARRQQQGRGRGCARRQERHLAGARSAGRVPGRQRQQGDRRLDHGQRAPGRAAQRRTEERLRQRGGQRRRLDAGLAPRHAARQRSRDRPERQGRVQRLVAVGRRRSSRPT